ncbi:MAG TPA: sulfite exporter TauE/SafE family protein [Polyangiaceae bacterium]|nr:sulfite exporter TauE/SafE family protein [Polyangiaceae bacterium]
MTLDAQLVFLAVVLGAYFVGTALGFGTSIMCVTFGAQLMPLEVLLPVIAPLNVTLSLYLAVRHRHATQWGYVMRRVVPLVALGIPLGMVLFNLREQGWLRLAFGLFVTVLATLQLRIAMKSHHIEAVHPWLRPLFLFGGGVVHGLFTTGGPLIVYVMGREIEDKGAFRSSIATMFVPMTTALIVDYALLGLFSFHTARMAALAAIPFLLGIVLGELAHHHIDNERFKRAVWALLAVGGVILSVRAGFSIG